MNESKDTRKEKEEWVKQYFRLHPDHSTNRCGMTLRKKFVHGFSWDTISDIRAQVVSAVPAKTPPKQKINGTIKTTVATADTKRVSDPDAWFQQLLQGMKDTISDRLPGVMLKSLSIKVDDNGKWDVEYDLRRTTNSKLKL